MTEGRSVYIQKHDYGGRPYKLASNKGVWRMTYKGDEYLRAATPSESPTSVMWQYEKDDNNKYTWRDDPALTVTGLSEKPSCECEVNISLSEDIVRIIKNPGVAGVYRAGGSYRRGRPVLQHSGGHFTLSVFYGGFWYVESGVGGVEYLMSGSAPSQCPADPRAARNERYGWTHWTYKNKFRGGDTESSGISIKCNKCIK